MRMLAALARTTAAEMRWVWCVRHERGLKQLSPYLVRSVAPGVVVVASVATEAGEGLRGGAAEKDSFVEAWLAKKPTVGRIHAFSSAVVSIRAFACGGM